MPRSYLATEENFAVIKELHGRNLIVPVVGNFGGPKAIRAVGKYLRARNAVVSAFYVSNVEQYLMREGVIEEFCASAASLPLDESSTFIRSERGGLPSRGGERLPTRRLRRKFQLQGPRHDRGPEELHAIALSCQQTLCCHGIEIERSS